MICQVTELGYLSIFDKKEQPHLQLEEAKFNVFSISPLYCLAKWLSLYVREKY